MGAPPKQSLEDYAKEAEQTAAPAEQTEEEKEVA